MKFATFTALAMLLSAGYASAGGGADTDKDGKISADELKGGCGKGWVQSSCAPTAQDMKGAPKSRGFAMNGVANNGVFQNGLWQNGLWQNGLWSNGMSANGAGAMGVRVESITLANGVKLSAE